MAYKIKGDVTVENELVAKEITVDNAFTLPTSAGTAGQVLQTNGISGTSWSTIAAGGGYTLSNVNVFASTGTWTKPAGLKAVYVIVQGAGGGGGGASSVSGTDTTAAGAGGGAGGRSEKLILAGSLGSTVSVTIGAGGGGGAGTGGTGGAGGTSQFGTICSATGGGGGQGQARGITLQIRTGGVGGVGSGGDINASGERGTPTIRTPAGTVAHTNTGIGGSSMFGAGGYATLVITAGGPGAGPGAGGGGGNSIRTSSSTNRPGGAGSAGIVIVYEYT